MRLRLIVQGAPAAAIVAVLTVTAVEFLQIGRQPPAPVPTAERADRIVVAKAARRLTLMRGDQELKSYAVSLGSAPAGHKQQEGDGRTPEGVYAVDFKHPKSRFHLALRVSYPGTADRERARQRGVAPGGDIMIHGLPNGLGWLRSWHLMRDWTDGCVAVTNAEIDEIWARVDLGTPVEITP